MHFEIKGDCCSGLLQGDTSAVFHEVTSECWEKIELDIKQMTKNEGSCVRSWCIRRDRGRGEGGQCLHNIST